MKKLIGIILLIGLLLFTVKFFGLLPNLELVSENNGLNQVAIKSDINQLILKVKRMVGIEAFDENMARSDVGETHLEGEIKKIYSTPRAVKLRLHMDDNHSQIENPIKIAPNAIFKIKEEEVTFRSLKIGDIVGIIVNTKGKARAITVYNR
ncbi:hypothetical protein [Selenihalanaerobacter shriftii]|uniref:Uncharacterized protein n=1 Tax=Selenihalanaerobacter shriftii TaxID=142842 RepID=A0A1T4KCT9_9FIRM|nr:hypothetical protein [Selenihalanaerobacter shriftii]SJZ40268.1 hypothetical protein SAMN02745118_00719 [Selenihalanaerobacter shriftii]